MKTLLQALDTPLYIAIGMGIASLLSRKNIFAGEPVEFACCLIAAWGVSYLIRRYKANKQPK